MGGSTASPDDVPVANDPSVANLAQAVQAELATAMHSSV
jgi:hypothetical protein